MRVANDVRSSEILRHGAYVCFRVPEGERRAVAGAAVPALAERLGLRNEFDPGDGHPQEAVAFLRRAGATPADMRTTNPARGRGRPRRRPTDPVAEFCAEVSRPGPGRCSSSAGRRPMLYTGNAMHNAYAHRVLQQPGPAAPNAFLVPMSKTAAWWAKDWMARHTYMLPRYDDEGRMVNEGHARAAEAGIACLLRRTYKYPSEPAPEGSYDFLTYFECADADVPTFHAVCAALRDVTRNPEWKFVREGPTWHGRRVGTWAELFA
jgi:hypothetical protein